MENRKNIYTVGEASCIVLSLMPTDENREMAKKIFKDSPFEVTYVKGSDPKAPVAVGKHTKRINSNIYLSYPPTPPPGSPNINEMGQGEEAVQQNRPSSGSRTTSMNNASSSKSQQQDVVHNSRPLPTGQQLQLIPTPMQPQVIPIEHQLPQIIPIENQTHMIYNQPQPQLILIQPRLQLIPIPMQPQQIIPIENLQPHLIYTRQQTQQIHVEQQQQNIRKTDRVKHHSKNRGEKRKVVNGYDQQTPKELRPALLKFVVDNFLEEEPETNHEDYVHMWVYSDDLYKIVKRFIEAVGLYYTPKTLMCVISGSNIFKRPVEHVLQNECSKSRRLLYVSKKVRQDMADTEP